MKLIGRILNFILGNCVVIGSIIFIIFLIGLVSFLSITGNQVVNYFCNNFPSKGENTNGVVIDFRDRANQSPYFRYEVKIKGYTRYGTIGDDIPGYDTIEINDTVPVYYFPEKVGDNSFHNYFWYKGIYKVKCN